MDTREKHSRRNPEETSNFLSALCFGSPSSHYTAIPIESTIPGSFSTALDSRLNKIREIPWDPRDSIRFIFDALGWTVPIFWKGAKRDLNLTDLYDPLKSDESERLGDCLEREWNAELVRKKKNSLLVKDRKKKAVRQPNLMWALTRMFWVPHMMQGLLLLVQNTGLRVMQPILQGWIIGYFNPGEKQMTTNEVLLYAGFLVIVILGMIFVEHHTVLRTRQIGMCVRVACCSLIYRKILRLNRAAVNNTAAGQVANLISNDVARFDGVFVFLHHVWIMPIQMSLIGYIMWQSVGVATLVGMAATIMQTIPIQGYLSSLGANLRSKIAVKTDERVHLTSELVSGIQVVKMYSWEKPFELIVSKVRALEMKLIAHTSYLRAFIFSMIDFCPRVSLYFTLITFVLMGNDLTAEITFVLVGLFSILQKTCNIFFPQAIILAGEASVSLERITKFLLSDEVEYLEKVRSITSNELQTAEKTIAGQQVQHQVGIEMTKVTANWVHDDIPPTLCKVSMKIRSQSLCALVGPVGSGKSSLLHLILGELSVQTGQLSLFTDESSKTKITSRDLRISYASQDPWLFSATIRDNILFGQPYDERRYQEVTRVCALLQDFEQLPQGDLSFVGESGAALSGGQKARVNLARAVYRDADLYLLDDPLSAVDTRVGRQLFEECITGYLKDKTRILVTHHQQYLWLADTVVALNRGVVEYQGTYDELVKTNFHILHPRETKELYKDGGIEENHEEQLESKITSRTAGDDNQLWKVAKSGKESKGIDKEEMAKGNIPNKVCWDYFLAGGNICWLTLLTAVFIAGQIAASGTDYWVAYWTNQEAQRIKSKLNKSIDSNTIYHNDTTNSQWFDENGLLHQNLGIYAYTICVIICILCGMLRSMLFSRMCVNASRNIHDTVFANLLQATMRFFNTNPSGRILNRFTKDMGAMDELLPRVMLHTLRIFVLMMGIFILVTLTNNWMILPVIALCGFFYTLRIYYLKTAQDVKRLEGITKSPMFSHASSTLAGLITIRSRGAAAERLLCREFDRHQNAHTGAWYLSIATATAFGFILDMTSCCFIACICFSFILMDDGDTLGGFVGLALSQSLILTETVQFGIRLSTELVSQMTSVERIFQYTKLPQEGPFTTHKPPPLAWPSKGCLIFKDVSMRYADDHPPVLKNLNLTVNSGWKIGIVGRTGAGKSSIISALFRLNGDGLEGEILLDGINTKSIGLHELRPRISIIPQEPILFSSSLRQNLDPFEQYSDAELWNSLREVELGDVVSSLDFQVTGGGANFSVGQRQLICLARAILRNNRLLVLDEATANVDHSTDALIQTTIRRRFADCTVLTIAHRLETIMDNDRVLVMKEGCIVEFDHPHLLLKNQRSYFFQMLQQTGKATSEKLAGISEKSFLLGSEFRMESNEPPLITHHITHL